MVVGLSPVAVTYTSDIVPVSSKEFLEIQANIKCRFTLKRVRDRIRTYSTAFRNSVPYHKDVHWLHHRWYIQLRGELHKSEVQIIQTL